MSDTPDGPAKKVLLAAPRGYCAGVDRAVITVEKALDLYGAPVYVRKQIVHNKHVVSTLEQRGAVFVDETDQVPEGATVIFSAHGVAPVVHEEAKARSLKTIDATCPLVTKVHHEARRFASEDFDILLIGHDGHEEVVGTAGEAPEHIQLVDGPDHADRIEVRDPERVVWLSQTTLSVDETMETVRRLRARFPKLQDPPSDDICYATQNRQVAVKELAGDCDVVIVVGSRNSSNSVRLVEVALEHGARRVVPGGLRRRDRPGLARVGASTVGVTSGASVPEILVRDVLTLLAQHGYDDVQPVVSAEESLLFSLPVELRRDLKAAAQPRPEPARPARAPREPVLQPASASKTGFGQHAGSSTSSRASVPRSSSSSVAVSGRGLTSSGSASASGAVARSRSDIRRAVTSTRCSSVPTSAL